MDRTFLDSLLATAKAAAPFIGHGAPQAIALGERLVDTINKAKAMAGGTLPVPLEEERMKIEAAIRGRVAETTKALRGK